MASNIQRGELDVSSFMEVEDEDENTQLLFTVTFAEAIELRSQRQAPPLSERSRTRK